VTLHSCDRRRRAVRLVRGGCRRQYGPTVRTEDSVFSVVRAPTFYQRAGGGLIPATRPRSAHHANAGDPYAAESRHMRSGTKKNLSNAKWALATSPLPTICPYWRPAPAALGPAIDSAGNAGAPVDRRGYRGSVHQRSHLFATAVRAHNARSRDSTMRSQRIPAASRIRPTVRRRRAVQSVGRVQQPTTASSHSRVSASTAP